MDTALVGFPICSKTAPGPWPLPAAFFQALNAQGQGDNDDRVDLALRAHSTSGNPVGVAHYTHRRSIGDQLAV